MKIQWITKDESKNAVTIYDNNIRLSKKAADYFENAYAVAIGIDSDSNNLIIKKVSKEEAESHIIDKNQLHKISIKASYARITGKKIIDELKTVFDLDFKTPLTCFKFGAKWNTGDKMLIVEMGECKHD